MADSKTTNFKGATGIAASSLDKFGIVPPNDIEIAVRTAPILMQARNLLWNRLTYEL